MFKGMLKSEKLTYAEPNMLRRSIKYFNTVLLSSSISYLSSSA